MSNVFRRNHDVMSCSLLPEILGLIINHLHIEPTVLKACRLLSKSCVPRSWKHLSACIQFCIPGPTVASWINAFPNPSNSPSQYKHDLYVSGLEQLTVGTTWIRSFRHVEKLMVGNFEWAGLNGVSLTSSHGLPHNPKSLHLIYIPLLFPEVLDLICSSPLLENLVLRAEGDNRYTDADGWATPLTSLKSRILSPDGQNPPATRALLNLLGGLHFTKITMCCYLLL